MKFSLLYSVVVPSSQFPTITVKHINHKVYQWQQQQEPSSPTLSIQLSAQQTKLLTRKVVIKKLFQGKTRCVFFITRQLHTLRLKQNLKHWRWRFIADGRVTSYVVPSVWRWIVCIIERTTTMTWRRREKKIVSHNFPIRRGEKKETKCWKGYAAACRWLATGSTGASGRSQEL